MEEFPHLKTKGRWRDARMNMSRKSHMCASELNRLRIWRVLIIDDLLNVAVYSYFSSHASSFSANVYMQSLSYSLSHVCLIGTHVWVPWAFFAPKFLDMADYMSNSKNHLKTDVSRSQTWIFILTLFKLKQFSSSQVTTNYRQFCNLANFMSAN